MEANATRLTIGKFHLSRADYDNFRFNTIEYRNYPGHSYIKFLVHNGDNNISTTDVLELNGYGVSEFNKTGTNGYGVLEIGGESGGLVDLISPFSDDYDLRMIHAGGESKVISK